MLHEELCKLVGFSLPIWWIRRTSGSASYCRWSLQIWKLVRNRLRHGNCGIEHSAVQHRIHMRNVLLAGVLRIIPLVFTQIHHSDGHWLLSSQLVSSFQQWRLVQPTQATLRLGWAHFLDDRPVQSKLHPRCILQVLSTYTKPKDVMEHVRQLGRRIPRDLNWVLACTA